MRPSVLMWLGLAAVLCLACGDGPPSDPGATATVARDGANPTSAAGTGECWRTQAGENAIFDDVENLKQQLLAAAGPVQFPDELALLFSSYQLVPLLPEDAADPRRGASVIFESVEPPAVVVVYAPTPPCHPTPKPELAALRVEAVNVTVKQLTDPGITSRGFAGFDAEFQVPNSFVIVRMTWPEEDLPTSQLILDTLGQWAGHIITSPALQ